MRRTDADAGIHCPNCGCTFSSVVNTESITNAIRRRRECLECGVRWTTFEGIQHFDKKLESEKRQLVYAKTDAKEAISKAIKMLQEIQI